MDFSPSAEDQAFRAMTRDFAQREIEPRWRIADDEAEFPLDLLTVAHEAGLMGLSLDVGLGGQGANAHTESIFVEETSRVNPNLSAGLFLQGSLVPALIAEHATLEQREQLLGPLLRGEQVISLAVTEPTAGSDVQGIRTSASKVDGGWVLDGQKSFITLANYARYLLVLAYVDKDLGTSGMSFFVVPTDTDGVHIERMNMWANRPIPTCKVAITEVFIPENARIPAGFPETMRLFNKERLLVSSRWLGHARHCLDFALDYATGREQFGRRLGDFQSIAFSLAEAHADIEAAAALIDRATWAWDNQPYDKELIRLVSSCKLCATETAYAVSQTALHIAGGWGLVKDELDIGRLAIDAFIAPVTVGSTEIQKRSIARSLGLRTE